MADEEDPLTTLGEMAVQLHELFRSYVAAGFTEQQALYLIGKLIAGHAAGSA